MFTTEMMKSNKKFAEREAVEAGTHTFMVKKILQKVPERGFFAGRQVYTMIAERTEKPGQAIFQDVAVPVYPEGGDEEALQGFQKDVRSLAAWAEILGVVSASPPRPAKDVPKPEASAMWNARDEWAVEVTNAVVESNAQLFEGTKFVGTIAIGPAGYPKLVKKAPFGA